MPYDLTGGYSLPPIYAVVPGVDSIDAEQVTTPFEDIQSALNLTMLRDARVPFTNPVTVPNATASGHAVNRGFGDTRYALLSGATFTGAIVTAGLTGTTGTFSGVVSGADATADGHLLNRLTADGRFVAAAHVGSGGAAHANATTSVAGFMSAADKTALDAVPTYRVRASVNMDSLPLSGTYSRTGTLVTVTMTAHGMTTGQAVAVDFTTGTATDGYYTVTVTGVDEFQVTDSASGTTSGNVTRQLHIKSAFNIASVVDNGVGDFTVNFTTALPDAGYTLSGFSVGSGITNTTGASMVTFRPTGATTFIPQTKTTTAARLIVGNPSTSGLTDSGDISIMFFR